MGLTFLNDKKVHTVKTVFIHLFIMAKAELKCRLREETWEHVLQISSETINCCQKMKVFAIYFVSQVVAK